MIFSGNRPGDSWSHSLHPVQTSLCPIHRMKCTRSDVSWWIIDDISWYKLLLFYLDQQFIDWNNRLFSQLYTCAWLGRGYCQFSRGFGIRILLALLWNVGWNWDQDLRTSIVLRLTSRICNLRLLEHGSSSVFIREAYMPIYMIHCTMLLSQCKMGN